MKDLRPLLFDGCAWYQNLAPSDDALPSAWYSTRGEDEWAGLLLSSAAAFAQRHGLVEVFRKRFEGIHARELSPTRAASMERMVTAPILAIAHELVVACFLEKVMDWSFDKHEPLGYKGARGDWEFITPSGRSVFVEVKTIEEPEFTERNGFINPEPELARIRSTVRHAYPQLPDDHRCTLVVLVGREIMGLVGGILFSNLFQAMFGRFEVRFKPFQPDREFSGGPSMHNMLVHTTKHRRVGCAAGMHIVGTDVPHVLFYAVDNPYANPEKRIPHDDLANANRFLAYPAGGTEARGLRMYEVWERMSDCSIRAG